MVSFGWFEVRRSHLSDIPDVYKIDARSMVSSFSEDSFVDRIVHYSDLFLVSNEYTTNSVIGYIVGSHDMFYTGEFAGYIYISRFAVKNKHRRKGIGTSMLLCLEHAMMMTGKYKGIVADARLSNKPSLGFFESCGYKVSKELSRPDGYKRGDSYEDRYKVVLYKKFPTCNC